MPFVPDNSSRQQFRQGQVEDADEVAQQRGWLLILISLLLAAIFAFGFRLYFAPQKIKTWMDAELAHHPLPVHLRFKRAAISLAQGSWPQLALRLEQVEIRSPKSCASDPGVRISEILIPVRIGELLQGRVALGKVRGAHLEVDLDALRDRCESGGVEEHLPPVDESGRIDGASPTPNFVNQAAQDSALSGQIKDPITAPENGSIRPWWTTKQLNSVREWITGLVVSSVTLRYENGTKSILFDDVLIAIDGVHQVVRFSSDVRVPPQSLMGKNLPPFTLRAVGKAESADIEIKGNLGEGTWFGTASLRAAPDNVEIEGRIRSLNIPLAATLPFLQNAGLVRGPITPRFMWLNCEASVKGRIKRLLKENPIKLEKCILAGESGKIEIDHASIGPGTHVEPFSALVTQLDVGKVLHMLGSEGPRGVFSRFGMVAGKVDVHSHDEISFDGAFLNSYLRFSRHQARVEQFVPIMGVHVEWGVKGFEASLASATLAGGRFLGKLAVQMDRGMRAGKVKIDIENILFHPDVQKLMVGGEMSGVKIRGSGGIESGRLTAFNGDIEVHELHGDDLSLRSARVQAVIEKESAEFVGKVDAGTTRRSSLLFQALKPAFLGHEFKDEWISWKDLSGRLFLQDRVLSWKQAKVHLEKGQVILSSKGELSESKALSGWLGVDFPRVKKLRWDLRGTRQAPLVASNEKTTAEIKKRWPITDAVLGIKSDSQRKDTSATTIQ